MLALLLALLSVATVMFDRIQDAFERSQVNVAIVGVEPSGDSYKVRLINYGRQPAIIECAFMSLGNSRYIALEFPENIWIPGQTEAKVGFRPAWISRVKNLEVPGPDSSLGSAFLQLSPYGVSKDYCTAGYSDGEGALFSAEILISLANIEGRFANGRVTAMHGGPIQKAFVDECETFHHAENILSEASELLDPTGSSSFLGPRTRQFRNPATQQAFDDMRREYQRFRDFMANPEEMEISKVHEMFDDLMHAMDVCERRLKEVD